MVIERIPDHLAELDPYIARSDGMVVMLALKIVPLAFQTFVICKARNVHPHVASAGEALHMLVVLFKAVVGSLLDEALPLIGRIGQKALLGRDNRPICHLCSGDGSCGWRWFIDLFPIATHASASDIERLHTFVIQPSSCRNTCHIRQTSFGHQRYLRY